MPPAASKTVFEESFGRRLRRERERRQISLSSMADNTKISVSLFEDLERDDASRWPSGIFRRSFIRSYAQALGLDADAIAHEFLERFPDPNDPDAFVSHHVVTPPPPPQAHTTTSLRLTLAADNSAFRRERLLRSLADRLAAIACDMAVVATIGLAMYAVLGTFWMPLCIALGGYYAGGVLLLGNTPGVCLCAPGDRKRGPTIRGSLRRLVAQLESRVPRQFSTQLPHVPNLVERARKKLGQRRPTVLRNMIEHGGRKARPARQPELVDRSHDAFEAAQLIHTRRGTENA
jgi:transcriptional regulator with XRE-family HTH domain